MKTIKLISPRYRLLTGILALAVSLGALMTAPPPASAAVGCSEGCVDWAYDFCYQSMLCCVDLDTGDWIGCWTHNHYRIVRDIAE
jgi:hypothetical protein